MPPSEEERFSRWQRQQIVVVVVAAGGIVCGEPRKQSRCSCRSSCWRSRAGADDPPGEKTAEEREDEEERERSDEVEVIVC